MADTTSSNFPPGMPFRTNDPSEWVAVPREVLLRNSLAPAMGLLPAESVTVPDREPGSVWARAQKKFSVRQVVKNRSFFMQDQVVKRNPSAADNPQRHIMFLFQPEQTFIQQLQGLYLICGRDE